MGKFIDFSGARPGAAAIKRAGIEGVLRYLSAETPSTSWKRATKNEIHSYIANGIDVILNFEYYQGRMLEGYNAGFNDGKTAMKQAKAIGYPKGATIYFSHDTSARNDTAILNYLRGARNAMKGTYAVDVYSGIGVVEKALSAGLARYGWQTLAWSNGRIGRAHIYQNGNMMFSKGADEDIIRHRPIGSWLETAKANVKPSKPGKPSKPVKLPKPPKKPVKVVNTYHVVKKGEYLGLIASHYKTNVAHLVSLNKKTYPALADTPNSIKTGWKLLVVQAAVAAPKPVAKPVPVKAKPVKIKVTYHTVKKGEYLNLIAAHYKVSIDTLVNWNKKSYPSLASHPDRISIGWKLRVK